MTDLPTPTPRRPAASPPIPRRRPTASTDRSARWRAVTSTCLVVAALLAASAARAQTDPPPATPPEPGSDAASTPAAEPPASTPVADPTAAEVQRLLAEAVAEYDAARYPEALALFQRAHALTPTARTLRGIGMAAFESGHYVMALRALRQALVATERPLTGEQRDHVTRLIARTEVFVATLELTVSPVGATVLVDGAAVEREDDGTLLLDQGHHTITAADALGRTQVLEVDLVGGTRRTLQIQLDTASGGGVADSTIAGVALLVTGGLATVASIATGVVALDFQARLGRECDGFVCPGELRATRDRATELSLATDVVGGAAAALMAGGIILLIVGATSESPPPVSVACGPWGCGAAWEL